MTSLNLLATLFLMHPKRPLAFLATKAHCCLMRSFLGCTTFRVGDLVKSKEQQLTLTLRTSDGGKTVGTIEVNLVKMGELEDGETDHITTDAQDQKDLNALLKQWTSGASSKEANKCCEIFLVLYYKTSTGYAT
ncbi:type ii inositol -bisphosphate 4-phosphatase- hypothetical protein [Limosa lapponica baueri]|uniref:Uncharacterized protein n=1 Tax=Limosa lapponica baueri TaxID=1758121 RepID=A0A2I0TC51_LIMLA|nr:type ii inositol -bisphosphate 4-phosphatase- hypothetical protein [Limosa lapponica baueri]